MRSALNDLDLDHLAVVYPGVQPYPLAENVSVVPLSTLAGNDPSLLLGRRARRS